MFNNQYVRSDSDLTAAAQIREAAMRLFGERGLAAVSVRDVAAAAGVSPALVIHHYKSKAGLKRAVDERAMATLTDMFVRAAQAGTSAHSTMSMVDVFSSDIAGAPSLLPYLRRLLIDGGEAATELFRAMYQVTLAALAAMRAAGLVTASDREDVRAAFLLVNDLGAVILREQIADVLGFDPVSPDGVAPWAEAVLEVYSTPTYLPPKEENA